jgi:hypothetical protein
MTDVLMAEIHECFVFLGRYAPHRSVHKTSKTRAVPCHQEHKLATYVCIPASFSRRVGAARTASAARI